MAGDGLVLAVGLHGIGRRAGLARVHAALQQVDVRLLGPVNLVHVDLPGAVQRALRGQYSRCKQQGPDRYKEQKSFHRVSSVGFKLQVANCSKTEGYVASEARTTTGPNTHIRAKGSMVGSALGLEMVES